MGRFAMALETLEQLEFRLNLEKLLEGFRDALIDIYGAECEVYDRGVEKAMAGVEIDVAVRKFIKENCK